MIKNLRLALYSEGSTDQRFLPIVLQRTSRKILERQGRSNINISPIESIEINKSGLSQEECIFQAACKAVPYHILIVHTDADAPTPEKALRERFRPGHERVQQTEEEICKSLLPIIPVRMTEAWMLADTEALQSVIGTDMSIKDLHLPRRTKLVELVADPKETLKQALRAASAHKSRRHRHTDLDFLYESLAREIKLDRLNEVPAYKRFKADLTDILKKLNLIHEIN